MLNCWYSTRGSSVNITPSQMKNRRRVVFKSGHIQVCDVMLRVQIAMTQQTIVLQEESHFGIRAICYRNILRILNSNDALRYRITGSPNKTSIKQVIDNVGYGLIAVSTVDGSIEIGALVTLLYFPKIQRHKFDRPWRLGNCELGRVISVSE